MAIVNSLSLSLSKEALRLFDVIDKDLNGVLNMKEINRRLSDLGLDEDELESLFFALDCDDDGGITKEEFQAGFCIFEVSTLHSRRHGCPNPNPIRILCDASVRVLLFFLSHHCAVLNEANCPCRGPKHTVQSGH